MIKFVTFVDGSNLDGTLKHLDLRVDDYGHFYRYIFEQAVGCWGRSFANGANWPTAQHSRINWYVVGRMDEWDLSDPRVQDRLRSRFEMNPQLMESYIRGMDLEIPPEQRLTEAWNACFAETCQWYEYKQKGLDKKKRFYHGVQAATDFVEIHQHGHWKMDLLYRTISEKGLDTSLAVDMVALQETYDVALLISGDADGIPGINYVKSRSKHVGVVEFRKGSAQGSYAKGTSSRLKNAADFVVQIYQADLLRMNISYRAEGASRQNFFEDSWRSGSDDVAEVVEVMDNDGEQ
jgi:uncharacterized LabA/DUF88 family protein